MNFSLIGLLALPDQSESLAGGKNLLKDILYYNGENMTQTKNVYGIDHKILLCRFLHISKFRNLKEKLGKFRTSAENKISQKSAGSVFVQEIVSDRPTNNKRNDNNF